MAQVEADIGRKLVWGAVNHHDTDNPHVHIVVRGLDADGADVTIDRRYISEGIRWRAQEILTRELGPKSELEIEQSQSKEVSREGFTLVDRMLVGHVEASGRVTLERLSKVPREERTACLARLQVLEDMKLASKERAGVWRLAARWDATLKGWDMLAEVRRRLHRWVPSSLGEGDILGARGAVQAVEGVVRGVGLHDEVAGGMYLVVQRADGCPCYVQARPEVVAGVAVGDVVKISSSVESWVKPTDRVIARVAGQQGGVYDPTAHEQALRLRSGHNLAPGQPSPSALVLANVRRLERLEKYGLVVRRAGGRWTIPGDLVARLEGLEKSHPRQRTQVERLGPARPIARPIPRPIDRPPRERPLGRSREPGLSR